MFIFILTFSKSYTNCQI